MEEVTGTPLPPKQNKTRMNQNERHFSFLSAFLTYIYRLNIHRKRIFHFFQVLIPEHYFEV